MVISEHVERLTVILKLTMTYLHLCNALFPLLWEYTEGCNLFYKNCPVDPVKNGLYPRCTYLALNPTIGAYAQYVYAWVHSSNTNGVVTLQGTLCGTILYGCPGRSDDTAHRLSGSAAQPKNLGDL